MKFTILQSSCIGKFMKKATIEGGGIGSGKGGVVGDRERDARGGEGGGGAGTEGQRGSGDGQR
jgi:hypothetical protein